MGYMMNDEIKTLATKTVTYSCGTTGTVEVVRERGSFYIRTSDYSQRYTTKKAALAALETY